MQLSNHHYTLIMAGGEGVRFAPLSTPEKPKQFLALLDPKRTLLQQTYDRLSPLFAAENILVATNKKYLPLVKEQLPQLKSQQIFGETEKKNTAPCLAWASFQLFQKKKEAVVVALPADQFITPTALFQETIRQAFELAKKWKTIVTIGIKPTFTSTHHGYLHVDQKPLDKKIRCFKVKEFVEKPDASTAQSYFQNGHYYWNGGTFIFPVQKMLEAVEKCLPEMFALLQKGMSLEDFFAKVPSISIDYGVMEKTQDLLALEAPFTWSDVGTWESLKKLSEEYSLPLPPIVKELLNKKPPKN